MASNLDRGFESGIAAALVGDRAVVRANGARCAGSAAARGFEAEYCGVREIDVSRHLNPALKSFEEWLAENSQSIPLG